MKLDSTQFGSHENERSNLKLVNDISNDLQKLLKYFSGTAIFTRLDSYLNDDKLFGI